MSKNGVWACVVLVSAPPQCDARAAAAAADARAVNRKVRGGTKSARSSRRSVAEGPMFPYLALTNRMTPNPEVITEWMATHGLQSNHHGITSDLQIILQHTGGAIPPELLKKHNPYFHRRGL